MFEPSKQDTQSIEISSYGQRSRLRQRSSLQKPECPGRVIGLKLQVPRLILRAVRELKPLSRLHQLRGRYQI